MPLAHIPMLLGIITALCSFAFLPLGIGFTLAIAACGVTLFLIGWVVGVVKLIFRTDLEWQQAFGIDQ